MAGMLIEELFARGIMKMGPSALDPGRQVGVFNMELVATLPAKRLAALESMKWLAGEWTAENIVPATAHNPAYVDLQVYKYAIGEKGNWICGVGRDGRERPFITFDPFSGQWMYVLAEGAYGVLRSPGWAGNRIVFSGQMMMIGVDCELRQTWTKESDDAFSFVNEERNAQGDWVYADEWRYTRKR
jgi:hypothetical protein